MTGSLLVVVVVLAGWLSPPSFLAAALRRAQRDCGVKVLSNPAG